MTMKPSRILCSGVIVLVAKCCIFAQLIGWKKELHATGVGVIVATFIVVAIAAVGRIRNRP